MAIQKILIPLIGTCGVIGNLLSIFIFRMPGMKSTSNTILMNLAISDLINVVVTIHCWSFQILTGFADEIMVPISYYLIYVTYTISEYLTVLLSIHRSTILSHPTIAIDYFTKSKVKIY